MNFRAHMMEKIRQLVAVHYELGKNAADDLKALRERWAFLDPNVHEVYLTLRNMNRANYRLAGSRPIHRFRDCSCYQTLFFYGGR